MKVKHGAEGTSRTTHTRCSWWSTGSRGWSYSSLEKLVKRTKHGETGTRKQRASRVHADIVDWADLAVKYECSRCSIRRKLSDRGFHTYKRCKTVHHEKRLAFSQMMYARLLSGTGKTRVRQKVQPLRLDKIVCSDEKAQIRRERAQCTELQSTRKSPKSET